MPCSSRLRFLLRLIFFRSCFQGFTKDITFDKANWVGYIKDYEGGTIMQVRLAPDFSPRRCLR